MREQFGPFVLDTATRSLERAGTAIHLTPKAFDLLVILIEASPRVVPKTELHRRLWPDSFVAEATLVGLIKRLRRALDDQGSTALIRTAHRVGYAFTGQLRSREALGRVSGHWLVHDGQRVVLTDGANIIGRAPESEVFVDAPGVSRRHARVTVGGGLVTLEDLGSRNGTLCAGERVKGVITLRDADRIQVADVLLVFRQASSGVTTEAMLPAPRRKS